MYSGAFNSPLALAMTEVLQKFRGPRPLPMDPTSLPSPSLSRGSLCSPTNPRGRGEGNRQLPSTRVCAIQKVCASSGGSFTPRLPPACFVQDDDLKKKVPPSCFV